MWNDKGYRKQLGDENLKVTIRNTDYGRQKRPKNVQYVNYLSSLVTNDANYKRGIKSRIAMEKAAFNKKKTLFTSKLDSNLGTSCRVLHSEYTFVWC